MYIEIIAIGVIAVLVVVYSGSFSTNKFIEDNGGLFMKLKENDYDFYVKCKYGDRVDPDKLFRKRIKNALIVMIALFVIMLNNLTYVNMVLILVATLAMFKLGYIDIKNFYKKHLLEIDLLLPYYLKNLEILVQHYTVPVALGKSIDDAPGIFKDGLKIMIEQINAGDSSIEPYMEFARTYPVRDSMRMMRLLYRLSLGRQERKQEQLLTFSKTISNLQQKARETKYKNRLEKMEGKTMAMLITTGVGVMLLIVLSVLQMMNI